MVLHRQAARLLTHPGRQELAPPSRVRERPSDRRVAGGSLQRKHAAWSQRPDR